MDGVVVVMSVVSGKVVDIEPLGRYCKASSTITRNLHLQWRLKARKGSSGVLLKSGIYATVTGTEKLTKQ